MKNEDSGKIDTIKNIKIESINVTWVIIGGEKKWIRKCPQCNKDLLYNYKPKFAQLKMVCIDCSQKNKIVIHKKEKFERNCPKCNSLITYTNIGNRNQAEKKNKLCKCCLNKNLSIVFTGRSLSDETKIKLSHKLKGRPVLWKDKIRQSLKQFNARHPLIWANNKNPMFGVQRFGKNNPNYGKLWSKEQIEKAILRGKEQFLNRLTNLGLLKIGYNPNACEYFDKLNKENNWNLQHALNKGEKRISVYFVDAYDEDKNIVVEYDESHHFYSNGNLKQKDIKRMNEIKNLLKCKFYRYNEPTQELKEY